MRGLHLKMEKLDLPGVALSIHSSKMENSREKILTAE
jgi:hypothetical protein